MRSPSRVDASRTRRKRAGVDVERDDEHRRRPTRSAMRGRLAAGRGGDVGDPLPRLRVEHARRSPGSPGPAGWRDRRAPPGARQDRRSPVRRARSGTSAPRSTCTPRTSQLGLRPRRPSRAAGSAKGRARPVRSWRRARRARRRRRGRDGAGRRASRDTRARRSSLSGSGHGGPSLVERAQHRVHEPRRTWRSGRERVDRLGHRRVRGTSCSSW